MFVFFIHIMCCALIVRCAIILYILFIYSVAHFHLFFCVFSIQFWCVQAHTHSVCCCCLLQTQFEIFFNANANAFSSILTSRHFILFLIFFCLVSLSLFFPRHFFSSIFNFCSFKISFTYGVLLLLLLLLFFSFYNFTHGCVARSLFYDSFIMTENDVNVFDFVC